MGSNRKNLILILQYWKKITLSIYWGTNNIFVNSTYTPNDIKRIILINQYFWHKIIPSSFSMSIILRYFCFCHFFLNPFWKVLSTWLKIDMEFNTMISLFWYRTFSIISALFAHYCQAFPWFLHIFAISVYFCNFCIFLQFPQPWIVSCIWNGTLEMRQSISRLRNRENLGNVQK